MTDANYTRRQFVTATASLASGAWLSLHWSEVAGAAESANHALHSEGAAGSEENFILLTASEVADLDAITNQIVPGGQVPGAREARAVYFIDRALDTFFSAQLAQFRVGLIDFQQSFAAHSSTARAFASAGDARQVAWLHQVDQTPFFIAVRRLTLLGLAALPKYGGNHNKVGWRLLGFEDRHIWIPPFGHYDRDYPGFEPYPGFMPYSSSDVVQK